MKANVDSIVAVMAGYKSGHDRLEEIRIKEIRESDVVRDAPTFGIAFESAKFLGIDKPITGLGELGKILAKINR